MPYLGICAYHATIDVTTATHVGKSEEAWNSTAYWRRRVEAEHIKWPLPDRVSGSNSATLKQFDLGRDVLRIGALRPKSMILAPLSRTGECGKNSNRRKVC